MVFRRLSVWLALGGVLLTIATLWGAGEKPPAPPPLEAPPHNPYAATVAAAGIIEAVNENVRIAPPVSGLVTEGACGRCRSGRKRRALISIR